MTAILPKELLTATLGGLSLLVVSGGSDGDVLVQQSDGTYAPETLVTGDVFGPASSTDNAIARFDATTGKLLQNCVVTIGDTGNIAGLGTVSCGAITASGDITLAASQRLFVSNGATTGNYLLSGATAVFANNSVAQGGWNTNGMYVRRLFIDYVNADICLARASTSNLGVYAGDGTTPAAITCGAITASGLVCMSIYTVATLPSASANAYKEANVSDALAPAMGVAVVGGGSVKTKVRSNGTDWTVCGI